MNPTSSRGMDVRAALQVLIDHRPAEAVVITNQGSARVWPQLESHPLDFHYNPSTMGGAIPFALGIALGAPQREVYVVSGDGALHMSLGALVTVAAHKPPNLTVVVLDNGRYEVTGGQQIAAAQAEVDYVGLAHSVGISSASAFSTASRWRSEAPAALDTPGPRLIALRVQAASAADLKTSSPPIAAQSERIRRALTPPCV